MYPFCQFGGFYLAAYRISLMVGGVVVLIGLFTTTKNIMLGVTHRINTFTFVVITAAVCSRVVWGLLNPQIFSSGFLHGFENLTRRGGFSAHGTILGVVLATFLVAWRAGDKRLFFPLIDICALFGVLAHAIGRIGCFLHGCCKGRETQSVLGVVYPGSTTSVHPVQLYESFLLLVLFFVLWERYKQKKVDGEVFLFYLAAYSCIRFFTEYFRWGASAVVVGGVITQAQIASIFIIIGSLIAWHVLSKRTAVSCQLSAAG